MKLSAAAAAPPTALKATRKAAAAAARASVIPCMTLARVRAVAPFIRAFSALSKAGSQRLLAPSTW